MMRLLWMLSILLAAILLPLVVMPVYAEVMSLKTDRSFYAAGSKIYFTGTVAITDYQKLMNIVIHDPAGKFVLISGNYSDSTYSFEIMVDTNNTSQFSTKGTYTATAFIGKESDGKIVTFDFSLDGSPVIHQTPQNTNIQSLTSPTPSPSSQSQNNSSNLPGTQNNTQASQTGNGTQSVEQVIQQRIVEAKNLRGMLNGSTPNPQNYALQVNETVGIAGVTGNLTKVATPAAVSSEKSFEQDFKNILYPIISLCGVGIVVTILYRRKGNWKAGKQRVQETQNLPSKDALVEPEDDYALMILKNRLAKGEITIEEFKAIKDELTEP